MSLASRSMLQLCTQHVRRHTRDNIGATSSRRRPISLMTATPRQFRPTLPWRMGSSQGDAVLVKRQFFATNTADESEWSSLSPDELRSCIRQACQQGNMNEATAMLSKAEDNCSENDSALLYPDMEELYTQVLDGWLDFQSKLSDRADPANVKTMLLAAEMAETILTRMVQRSTSGDRHVETHPVPRLTAHHFNLVIEAFVRVTRQFRGGCPKGIAQRAEHVLNMMEDQLIKDPLSEVQPTLESYHGVIEAWANSFENLRGTRAKKVFGRLFMEPTAETHRLMMRAWTQSDEKWAAHNATWHLTALVMDLRRGNREMEPTLEDYHLVLRAWSKASDKNKVGKARTVFRHVEEGYSFRHSTIQPDVACYRYLLETLASSPSGFHGPVADLLLKKMQERRLLPDTRCYSAAIRAWNNQVRQKSNYQTDEDAMKAVDVLVEMEKAHQRSLLSDVKPRTEDYNAVIQALSYSGNRGAAERAESLLSRMEKAATFSDEIIPNSDSFTFALYAWSRSGAGDKVKRATAILERIKDKDKVCHPCLTPNDRVLTAFVTVCGRVSSKTDELEKRHVWTLMVNTTEEMRAIGVGPNSVTYSWMISAGQRLLPPGDEREQALRNIFRSCCYDGLVDGRVLRVMRQMASEGTVDTVSRMVVEYSNGVREGNYVPREWTRNVGVRSATTEGPRAALPLTLEHGFDFTPAFDKKMQKLRSKENQRLLRGGRIGTTTTEL